MPRQRERIEGNEAKEAHEPPTQQAAAPTLVQSFASVGSDIQAQIGDQLRALHDDIVRQGVPERFVDLLARLDKPDDKQGE